MRTRRKDLDWIFSIQHERTVNNDNTIALDNRVFQLEKTRWRNTLAGQNVVVHEHLDGRVSIRYGPHVIAQLRAGTDSAASTAQARHAATGRDRAGGMNHKDSNDIVGTGGSASRPPGFNALGQDCGWGAER